MALRFVLLLAVLSGCAASRDSRSSALALDSRASGGAYAAALLRRQLAGHLDRARGCMSGPSWAALAFTIQPDGRVADVDVDARGTEDHRSLEECIRSRIVSLYFDPAPPERAVRIRRTFESCPTDGAVCRLGPIQAELASAELLERVAATLAERDDQVRACAAGAGGGRAVLDVRLELAPDGRIMAGQLRGSLPDRTPLARCGVGPLLGARVEGPVPERTMQLSYTYRIDGGSAH